MNDQRSKYAGKTTGSILGSAQRALTFAIGCGLAQVSSAQHFGFGPEQVVEPAADWPQTLLSVDMDGDGDPDLVAGSEGYQEDAPLFGQPLTAEIVWYENVDGLGSFGPARVISDTLKSVQSIFAADLDGDGDPDLLCASGSFFEDGRISWFENLDGLGNFGSQQTIATGTQGAISVLAADLDDDGDRDLVSSLRGDGTAWYENTDGQGTFAKRQVLTAQFPDDQVVRAADLDGDGDLDLLEVQGYGTTIKWFENTDGQGTFGTVHSTPDTGDDRYADAAAVADFDGDGDPDVLMAYRHTVYDQVAWTTSYELSWYENTDGLGTFGIEHPFATPGGDEFGVDPGFDSVFAADLNNDGDLDAIWSWTPVGLGQVVWYENADGQGSFGAPQALTGAGDGAHAAIAADLDGNGFQDVIAAPVAFRKVVWYASQHEALMGSLDGISLASGGAQQLLLTAGVENALRPYLLLGSLSGTSPGIPLDALVLPLNADEYFVYTLMNPNNPGLLNSLSTIALDGTATVTATVPPGLNPSFAGLTLHHAYCVFDLTSSPGQLLVNFVSNAVSLSLLP